jgi:hypothetical protein
MAYQKDLVLHKGNAQYHFSFRIFKEYQNTRFANGNLVKGYGYSIYVVESPNQSENLRNSEYHFIASTNPPKICWDTLITDFDDARYIMFTWAKNYVKLQHKNNQIQQRNQSESGFYSSPNSFWFDEIRSQIRRDEYKRIAFEQSVPGKIFNWIKRKINRE